MEIKELTTKTPAELQKLLAQYREKLRELRFKDSNRQLKNVREIRQVREIIARIFTVLNTKV
ncbi:50S ribosomal protein L29 [Patescibacteria group bacterium]|jgi:ribosomal protein L29|nr:50S ribosomal protein L29 [Patescibacteria group bacterium]